MRVLIVADDLTGAFDTAVTLRGRGLSSVVARRAGDVGGAVRRGVEVVAVSTASREGSAAAGCEAVAAVFAAVGALPEIVFKKVDSRLKGHVAAETAAVAAATGLGRALVAPAIPAQGRRVEGGRLVGNGVAAPVDVAAALAASGLELVVPDTRDDADLDAALEKAGTSALLVGAAGLAAAVGRRIAPGAAEAGVPALRAPVLLAIGSHDPITVAQVERITGRPGVAVALAPDGACPRPAAGVGAQVMRLVPEQGRPFDARRAGARFAADIARLVREGGFATLLGCGGETADAILGELGAGVFEVEGEVVPGVPVSAMDLDGRRLQLVTKSGGFGDVDALAAVIEAAGSLEGAR
jgi:uncharacterized protein YgbK (DUF1537 family)